jgi:hypothetical protein
MAFLDDFVEGGTHNSDLVLGLNLVTLCLCALKILLSSVSQRIKRGILMTYITDILIDYGKSLILFVDLTYLVTMILLFVISIIFIKS